MKRFYFVTDDLNNVKTVENELQAQGLPNLQMHLLTEADAEADKKGLDNTPSLSRKDIPKSMIKGFCVGLIAVAILVAVTLTFNIPGLSNGLMLLIASGILLGFCTWEGAFLGIQRSGSKSRRFAQYLKRGKHLFYVDANPGQVAAVKSVFGSHRGFKAVGTESGESDWMLGMRRRFRSLAGSGP